ncbi:bacteriorhodopsin-like [Arenimonas sp.]|uniref:bacteriorhodopsin-like n=1 Tax=Arenimonas sp. TaxID=1872635 RepID=UPI0025B9A292|nr:bacteriorhodopsin-like [Arenimonas sp.]
MEALTAGQFSLVYNAFSFGIATFAAATLFFWFGRSQVSHHYKTALTITGLVTFIALYHYWRIFDSWGQAYEVANGVVTATGVEFNRAYRYVDWLLTVPLLLIELILVMRLSQAETVSKSLKLGGAAALMILLGYPGEVSEGIDSTRLVFGALSMVPFLYIVFALYTSLGEAIERQHESVRGLIRLARNLTVVSWFFYPVVYFLPFVISMNGGTATAVIELGYTVADITAKAVFGLVIYAIAVRKSEAEGSKA